MRNRFAKFCGPASVGLFLLALTSNAGSTPLRVDYSVTELGGGLFDYEFELILDNNDGSWAAGQGWRWIVFGDDPSASPLTNFVLDVNDLPIGPYTFSTTSVGGHNGPTLQPVLDYWVPASVGDRLAWSGTSDANLAQNELLFSTLAGTLNNGVAANFEVANRVGNVPEPATLAMLAIGLAGAGYLRRKQINSA